MIPSPAPYWLPGAARLLGAALLAGAAPLLLSACRRPAPVPEPVSARPWVAGDAARHLDPEGHFRLPPIRVWDSLPLISPERAKELAVGFAGMHTGSRDLPKNFHGERLNFFEKTHGDAIDFKDLRPGPRAYLALPPYASVPRGLPDYERETYEPHYLVPLYTRAGLEALRVTVPAVDIGYWIDELGRPRPPGGTGAIRLSMSAVSAGAEYPVPLDPECAAQVTAQAAGRRVAEVPELVQRNRLWHPEAALWKLTLDGPATVRVDPSGEVDTTRVLYVGLHIGLPGQGQTLGPVWYRAHPDSATAAWADVPQPVPPPRRGVQAPLRTGHATYFQRVTPRYAIEGRSPPHFPCRPLRRQGW